VTNDADALRSALMASNNDHADFVKEVVEIMDGWGGHPDDLSVPLVDAGLTSLSAAEIGALLEFRYDVVFPLERFLDDKLSISDLIEMIETSKSDRETSKSDRETSKSDRETSKSDREMSKSEQLS
jgi:acyl carrier protein